MADNPRVMRASVLVAPGEIEMRSIDVPELQPRQVLVKVMAVGVCGSDTHFYETGRIGDLVAHGAVVLGHESAGIIIAVGSEISEDRLGVRVSVEPKTICRRCEHCKSGDYNLCSDVKFYGAWPCDGSFAEYEVIDDDFAHVIPESVTFERAAMVEPVSVAVHAARRGGVTAGSRVLITGAGPIGVLVAQVSHAFGATEVVVSDPVVERRSFALAHGATKVVEPSQIGRDDMDSVFDVYIDASGSPRAIEPALAALRSRGTAVLVGMGADRLDLPFSLIQQREITLTGTFRYANTWPTAIALIATGAVQVDALITGRFTLDDVETALLRNGTDPAAIKSIVLPNDDEIS